MDEYMKSTPTIISSASYHFHIPFSLWFPSVIHIFDWILDHSSIVNSIVNIFCILLEFNLNTGQTGSVNSDC